MLHFGTVRARLITGDLKRATNDGQPWEEDASMNAYESHTCRLQAPLAHPARWAPQYSARARRRDVGQFFKVALAAAGPAGSARANRRGGRHATR